MAYVRDATAADAPGIAAVWRAGLFAAYPGIIAADIIERCPLPTRIWRTLATS